MSDNLSRVMLVDFRALSVEERRKLNPRTRCVCNGPIISRLVTAHTLNAIKLMWRVTWGQEVIQDACGEGMLS